MQPTPSRDTATPITYQPQLLAPAKAPHSAQRYPQNFWRTAVASCEQTTPNRHVDVMRWADRCGAQLTIKDTGLSIDIDLDASALRTLAFQLLDAAHDIEHAPAPLEQAA